MLRLSERRRELLGEKFADAANVALGALVFGQFLSDEAYSAVLFSLGIALWLILITLAVLMTGERDGR